MISQFDAFCRSVLKEEVNPGYLGSGTANLNASGGGTTTPSASSSNVTSSPTSIPSVDLSHPNDLSNLQQLMAGKMPSDPNWVMDATNRGIIKDGVVTPAGQIAFQKKQNPTLGMS